MATPSGKIVIAGGSGFLGVALAEHLIAGGAEVVILSRNAPKIAGKWKHVVWDGRTLGDWRRELDGAAGLVNLAGRSINCVWTPEHREEILHSRIDATRILGEAVKLAGTPPPVWVQASAANIHGDENSGVVNEDAVFGHGFTQDVAKAWEATFQKNLLPSQRGVIVRISVVLGRDRGAGGGALPTLRRLAKFGLGGTVGPGTQGFSWIHELDMIRLFERGLTDPTMRGAYIASSPNPVSQKIFARQLRRTVGMPIGLPAFSWMVRIGAKWIMRTDPELALYGRYVVSKRLKDDGFEFQFPELRPALEDLLNNRA